MNLSAITKNPIVSFLLRFGLSGALLWYIFTKIDIAQVKGVLLKADPLYLVYGLLTFAAIHLFLLWRWYIFIRALGLKVRVFDMTRYFFAALFGNLFLPSSVGGDIIKIIGLSKDKSMTSKVAASVLLDRISGFAGIVIVAIPAYFLGYQFHHEKTLLIPIVLVLLASIATAFILFNEHVYSFICRIFSFFPKIQNWLMDVHHNLALMNDKKLEGFKGILLSSLNQVLLATTFFLVAKALGQDINIIYFLIFVPLICIITILPSIGGLGVREFGVAYLFAKIGIGTDISVAISLTNFVYMVIIGLLGGLWYVLTLSARRV